MNMKTRMRGRLALRVLNMYETGFLFNVIFPGVIFVSKKGSVYNVDALGRPTTENTPDKCEYLEAVALTDTSEYTTMVMSRNIYDEIDMCRTKYDVYCALTMCEDKTIQVRAIKLLNKNSHVPENRNKGLIN